MQVICTDGTTFTCEGYELSEYGVALYGQNLAREKDRYDSEPEQTGYIPHDRLWYILPDGVTPNVPVGAMGQGQVGQQPSQNGALTPPGQGQIAPEQGQSGSGQPQPGLGRQPQQRPR